MARRFFDIASAVNAIANYDDNAAFEFFFNTYYDKLYRIAYYYLSIDAKAEDAVSEVFYKVWAHRKKLNRVENMDSYLYAMTKNQCLTLLRTNAKMEYSENLNDFRQQITLTNPESQLISLEFLQYVNKHIGSLPPRCRIIFTMVKEDGLRYKEVAELLNISVKTVENQMTKAISQIRQIVSSYQTEGESLQMK